MCAQCFPSSSAVVVAAVAAVNVSHNNTICLYIVLCFIKKFLLNGLMNHKVEILHHSQHHQRNK